jgi:threonylcarbamoyladenosine tRNA methylthiotransferase MtaB
MTTRPSSGLPRDFSSTVKTFGCRLNIWESEVIKRHADAAGLQDAVIINTCAVTAEAEKQARQAVRKARRDHPDARVIVTGCSVQIDPQSWQDMAEVDAAVGNHEKLQPEIWRRLSGVNDDDLPSMVGDIMGIKDVAPHLLEGFDSRTRAFLQIQQGCDHRCTFCIIPYGRGGNRSVPMKTVIDQVKCLADNGIAEVVLTGVDVASWGRDLDGCPSLGQLVRRLLRSVPTLKRLRMSSIDPAEIDSDMIAALGEDQRLMPHLHLSVQHGDDLMLKRMKRRHRRDDVLRLVDTVRRVRPDMVFGADMIAGFPTEDTAAHAASLDLIKEAGLTWLHVFAYSQRDGTPAARMPQLDSSTIKARAKDLRQAAEKAEKAFLQTLIGMEDDVLLETGGIGHSRQFAKVRMDAEGLEAGRVYSVKVLAVSDRLLEVELR